MKSVLSEREKDMVVALLNTFQGDHLPDNLPLCLYSELLAPLDAEARQLILELCDLDPAAIDQQQQSRTGFVTPAPDAYSHHFVRLHERVHATFVALRDALREATGQELYVISGYRSPAYQMLIFLRELYNADFDLEQAQSVAKTPSDSEHGHYPHHAIDVDIKLPTAAQNRISTSFEKTDAYRWLQRHAETFGFVLSYPEGNTKQTIFEPWHWLSVADSQNQ